MNNSRPIFLNDTLANSSSQQYWVRENDAFSLSALVDLCTVRSVFREEKEWPELAPLVDWVFVMACVYRGRVMQMSPQETQEFCDPATTQLFDFQTTIGVPLKSR